jgi:hypothetical protein
LPDRVIQITRRLALAVPRFGDGRPHRLEEADVVANAERLVVRHGQRERHRELGDRLEQACFAVFLGEHVLLGARQNREALRGRSLDPGAAIEAVEDRAAHLVTLQHPRHGLVLIAS